MVGLGFLDDPKVELIEGLLVTKMSEKPPRTWASEAVRDALAGPIGPGWYIREEKPVRIPDLDEPEPDLTVTRGHRDHYRTRNSGPSDIALIVEVADTSLRRDRGEKLRAYARGGMSEYWGVDLAD